MIQGVELVGAVRFELTTLCSQSRCATRLRYAPTVSILPHSAFFSSGLNKRPLRCEKRPEPESTGPGPSV